MNKIQMGPDRKKRDMDKPVERLKWEIAGELGLQDQIQREGWGGLTSAEAGRIGGLVGRKLIQQRQKEGQTDDKLQSAGQGVRPPDGQ